MSDEVLVMEVTRITKELTMNRINDILESAFNEKLFAFDKNNKLITLGVNRKTAKFFKDQQKFRKIPFTKTLEDLAVNFDLVEEGE